MMNSFILSLALIISIAAPAMAQTAKPVAKPVVKVESLLEKAKKAALEDQAALEKLLAAENAKTNGNNVCVTNALSWQLRSDEWFLQNYSEFEKIEKSYEAGMGAILSEANDKWSKLRASEIGVLAVKGQKEQEVPVSFDTMVEYLKNYNSKLTACAPNQRRDLRKVQNDPHQNKYGIAVDQMVIAAKQMTSNINASLSDNPNQFQLVFSEDGCGFKLEFKAQFTNKGKTEAIVFDALSVTGNVLSISEEAKWARLLKDNPSIGGVATDGALRVKQFEAEAKLSSCERGFNGKLPTSSLNTPFQTLAAIQAEIDREIAMGARAKTTGGASVRGSSVDSQDWEEVVSIDAVPFTGVSNNILVTDLGAISVFVGKDIYSFNESKKWVKYTSSTYTTPVFYDIQTNTYVQTKSDEANVASFNNTSYLYHSFSPAIASIVGMSSGILYYLSADQKLYSSPTPAGSSWISAKPSTQLTADSLVSSLSFVGSNIYGVSEGNLVKLNVSAKKWEEIEGADFNTFGSDVIQAQAISPTEIYVITRNGELFQYANRQWQSIASSSGATRIIRFAANKNGKVCGVSFNGKIWCLNPGE